MTGLGILLAVFFVGILLNALFAGYETVSSTMGFVMYFLATNPECQEKVIEEIDNIVEGEVSPL